MAEIIANVADGADLRVTTLEVLESEDLTLTCNVIRANPTIYVYTWTQTMNLTFMEFEDNTTNISFTDFNILDAGTHICAVSNGAGIDTVNITIIFGGELFGHNHNSCCNDNQTGFQLYPRSPHPLWMSWW